MAKNNEKIRVTLPDGTVKEFGKKVTAKEVAESIGKRLAADAIVAEVDGKLVDLSTEIIEDSDFKIHTFTGKVGKEVFWYSASHLLGQAVIRFYPDAKLTIGPAWEHGFYYDIAHKPFHPSDLEKIEVEMRKIVVENLEVKRLSLSSAEALTLFKDNKYKREIIKEEAKGKEITAYQQGDFIDLCRGPHAPNTGMLKAFKLTKVSAAYWRGDQKNDELQRIYGIAFPEKKQLDQYLKGIELAEQNDHRKLGRELELFWFHDWSPGSPFFLPKGTVMYNMLVDFIKNECEHRGYTEIITPQLFNKRLWELSGHWQHYKENMFVLEVDNTEFSLKPMNCPASILVFKRTTRSYRELPMRLADYSFLHRNELRGVLAGLTRVRRFSQDDAHIFCTQQQIGGELTKLVDFVKYVYVEVFSFKVIAKLSTRPEKSMGKTEVWDVAEHALKKALDESDMKYEVKPGEGSFYGPKIDFGVKDALGREHQLATIQLDFQMPLKMGAEYEGADGKKHPVVMIHRAIIGSFERFIGLLVEHYKGKFPLWLSPVQVRILTVADRFNDYANKVGDEYRDKGIRVELDTRVESVSYKVREAELKKVNYILVVGEKEVKSNTVTVRTRDNKILGAINAAEFLERLLKEVEHNK